MTQVLTKLLASFSLAYLLAGFLHALLTVTLIIVGSHDFSQVVADSKIFLGFIWSEGIEAPLSGGFIRDEAGDGSSTSLYSFIAPIFIAFYFCFSRGWHWLKWTHATA